MLQASCSAGDMYCSQAFQAADLEVGLRRFGVSCFGLCVRISALSKTLQGSLRLEMDG